jgi:hypothetical protein
MKKVTRSVKKLPQTVSGIWVAILLIVLLGISLVYMKYPTVFQAGAKGRGYTYYGTQVMRTWPSVNPGHYQWADLTLTNASQRIARVTIAILSGKDGAGRANGEQLHQYDVTIEPQATYESSSDPNWTSLPDNFDSAGIQTLGWVRIDSITPLMGAVHYRRTNGDAASSPIVEESSMPILTTVQKKWTIASVFYDWPADPKVSTGKSQWSTITVINPNATSATVRINLFTSKAARPIQTYTRTIPAFGEYSTFEDWKTFIFPDIDQYAPGNQFMGSATIESTIPVFGFLRDRIITGRGNDRYPAELLLTRDMPFKK